MLSNTLKEAKRLHDIGFAVLWLHPKSKRPVGNAWASGPRKSWEKLKAEYREGMNVGVRLGTPSKIKNSYLCAIDCDVKSKEKKHLIEMRKSLKRLLGGATLPKVTSGRGNGSAHFYCRTREAFQTFTPYRSEEFVEYKSPSKSPSKKEREELGDAKIAAGWRLSPAWEISLYSDGRQCVLPPSIHPDTGKAYEWKRGVTTAFDLPRLKFEVPEEKEKSAAKKFGDADSRPRERFTFTPDEADVSWLPISDEVKEGIVTGAGVDDRSEFLLRAASALNSIGLNKNQILSILTHPDNYLSSCAYEHAQTKKRERAAYWLWKYTVRKVLMERSGLIAFDNAPKTAPKKLSKEEQAAQDKEMKGLTSWKDGLNHTKQGKVEFTLGNLDLIFTNTTKEKLFIQDLFSGRVFYGANAPWGGKKNANITDIDLTLIKHWLGEEYEFEPNTNLILEGVLLIAHRNSFHPVREKLQTLKWDGVKRIDTWLKDYCMAEAPEPYLSDISRKFLIAMVKRVFEPGCQWDFILILEGKQGTFKSTLSRALAGDDRWFLDNLPDLKDKDAVVYLQGKWVVELAELASIKKSDYSSVKAFFTRRIDTIRLPYAKTREDVPRQNVFLGTVNEGQYLKDPTGNRRYLPVKVGICDAVGIRENWEQLFAEAYLIYKENREQLFLDGEAVKQAQAAQEDRQVEDENSVMKELLLEFFKTDDGGEFQRNPFKLRDLFEGVNAPWGQFSGKYFSMQNGSAILARMGFEKVKLHGQRIWRMPRGMYLNGGSELEPKKKTKTGGGGGTTHQMRDFY